MPSFSHCGLIKTPVVDKFMTCKGRNQSAWSTFYRRKIWLTCQCLWPTSLWQPHLKLDRPELHSAMRWTHPVSTSKPIHVFFNVLLVQRKQLWSFVSTCTKKKIFFERWQQEMQRLLVYFDVWCIFTPHPNSDITQPFQKTPLLHPFFLWDAKTWHMRYFLRYPRRFKHAKFLRIHKNT